MNYQQAKQRILDLRRSIDRYRYEYHVLDKNSISEDALDSLKHELSLLESKYPDLITPDSPTQRVAGQPLPEFQKAYHLQPMLSLNDIFSSNELEQWVEKTKKLIPGKHFNFFVEPKLDGLAISLVYQNGQLLYGSTRGNGMVGEDVTQNIRTIETIPLSLIAPDNLSGDISEMARAAQNGRFEVRGEVVISRDNFHRLNEQRLTDNLPVYANPRNLAAGSIRQLDPKLVAGRKLDFIAWQVYAEFSIPYHHQEHQLATGLGFKTLSGARICETTDQVEKFLRQTLSDREKFHYQTDGAVINIDQIEFWSELGIVGKAPRYSVAYKFAAEEAATVIQDIVVQVGRTGALTPVAVMEPVILAGTTVDRATLHNEDEIRRKDVRIGDTVIIRKAGDVIPEVVSVLPEFRPVKAEQFSMPARCPFCDSKVVRDKAGAVARCSNEHCFGQVKAMIRHFVSKEAFDIDGLGVMVVEQLLSRGLVHDQADLFSLTIEDLKSLDHFADKSARNLYLAIQQSKKLPIEKFIYALGIRHVGYQTAVDITKTVNHHLLPHQEVGTSHLLAEFKKMSNKDFEQVDGIGEVVSDSLTQYFQADNTEKLWQKFGDLGLRLLIFQDQSSEILYLQDKSFAITGILDSLSRDKAEEMIREHGGKVSDSVSRTTSYLVVGKDPGSKLAKAKNLGVPTIGQAEFMKLLLREG